MAVVFVVEQVAVVAACSSQEASIQASEKVAAQASPSSPAVDRMPLVHSSLAAWRDVAALAGTQRSVTMAHSIAPFDSRSAGASVTSLVDV